MPFEYELDGLVLPAHPVEVEELGEVPLRVVGEDNLRRLSGHLERRHGQPRASRGGRRRDAPADGAAARVAVVFDLQDRRVELFEHTRERHDVQHSLAALEEVDDLTVAVGQHRVGADQDEVRRRQVAAEPVAQALDGASGPLQRDAGVEELLDDLELDHVGVGVDALRAAARARRRWRAATVPCAPSSRAGDR